GWLPYPTMLWVIDGSSGNLTVIFQFKGPDGFGIALRTTHVSLTEHIPVIIASFSKVVTVTRINALLCTSITATGCCLFSFHEVARIPHAYTKIGLCCQLSCHVLIDSAFINSFIYIGQVRNSKGEIFFDQLVHLCNGLTCIIKGRNRDGLFKQRYI